MSEIEALQHLIHTAGRILVVTHVAPDGDALGSLTAMAQMLGQLGKQVTAVCDDGVPERFQYLTEMTSVYRTALPNSPYDLLIALDCGDESRMGRAFADLPEPKPPVINIDHHVTNTTFGQVNLVDTGVTATAEILFNLLPALDVRLTSSLAMSLLTGIVTDTLGFRINSVTPRTLQIASALMEAGADLPTITARTLNLKPLSTILLWQKGLNNAKLEDGLLWATISKAEREAVGHQAASSAGLVNLLGDVCQAAVGAVLLEMDGNKVYVGFRCRPPYSVSQLAMNLGGGGHDLAAGCTLEGPLNEVESLVVAMSKESIQQQFEMSGRAYGRDC